jgi:molybdopterin adenylyltransferase
MVPPHPNRALTVICAVITVSDTRTPETDRSGQLMQQLLTAAGHQVGHYAIVPDEPEIIRGLLATLGQRSDLAAVLLNGGTGIAPRDTTYDAIAGLLTKTLPGFGEIFRALSYAEIGSRAIASRAIAGTYGHQILFSVPGSTPAVNLAMVSLILPELPHLVSQIQELGG